MARWKDTANRDALYGRKWRNARAEHLRANPLCAMCKAVGRVTPAKVVDHVEPHRGDPALFWARGNWQSLCPSHHNSAKQREERGSRSRIEYDARGFPIWPTAGAQ